MRTTIRVAAAALVFQAACGSGGGIDGAASDAPRIDARDGGDTGADGDAPAVDAPEDRADVSTMTDGADDGDVASGDAADVSPEAGSDASGGCRVSDGLWTALPLTEWSNNYKTAWGVGPATFLYYTHGANRLRKWNGSRTVAFPTQPPAGFGTTIRGSGENDVWLIGGGVVQRAGITDRLEALFAHWDGATWKDQTLVVTLSSPLPATSTDANWGGTSAFWSVAPNEAWVWVYAFENLAQNQPATIFGPYHLVGSTWERVPSPLDALGATASPVAAWGSSRNDVWVGGSVARAVPATGDASAPTTAYDPLMLHWDGSQWTQVSLPIASGDGQRRVNAVWGSAANDVWAVGRTDTSADTWHFDGTQWTEIPVAGPVAFNQVLGSCPGDFWAVSSTAMDPPWRFDGTVWSRVTLPVGITPTGYLAGTGSGDVWISAQSAKTCAPYEQGPLPIMAHWGRNRCGDGVVAGDETCDPPRSTGDGQRCDQTCHRPRCGNGVVDPGEDCDPPNRSDGLQCDETCHRPLCGNGVLDSGEACDPPMSGSCDSQCRTILVKCGDGVVEPGETCDFPDPGQILCRSNCTSACMWPCELSHPNTWQGTCGKDFCASLNGADHQTCNTLRACMLRNYCVSTTFLLLSSRCFCSDDACSRGADGPCVAEARAFLETLAPNVDTSDPIVLQDEVYGTGNGNGTLLGAIAHQVSDALRAPQYGCNMMCNPP